MPAPASVALDAQVYKLRHGMKFAVVVLVHLDLARHDGPDTLALAVDNGSLLTSSAPYFDSYN